MVDVNALFGFFGGKEGVSERTSEEPREYQVRCVTVLSVRRDVAEAESVEPGPVADARVDGVDREEDDPREDPDGKQQASDHAEEADVEVGIEPVDVPDALVVCIVDGERPSKE